MSVLNVFSIGRFVHALKCLSTLEDHLIQLSLWFFTPRYFYFEILLRSYSCFLAKIIVGKAIICSLEWPNLSPLQAVFSRWSLWIFRPYLVIRLPLSPSPPPPPQEPNKPHFLWTSIWYFLHLSRTSWPSIHLPSSYSSASYVVWDLTFMVDLSGPHCALSQTLLEILILSCHWNAPWIAGQCRSAFDV